jgi:hypothetical protein
VIISTFAYTNEDHAAVASATKILVSRYRAYVEYQDVQQELYLWLFQNYHKAERWRDEKGGAHAERMVVKALRNCGERYCRNEKAEKDGYETQDEFFYSIPMVADLLQLYFDPDWSQPAGLELTSTSSGRPASEGGNLIAMVADVGRAYEALPAHDRQLLDYIYNRPAKDVTDAIAYQALQWQVTQTAANSRIRRVVGRLRAALGGPSPYGKDAE